MSCTGPQTPQQLPHTCCDPKPGSRVPCGVLGMFSPPLSPAPAVAAMCVPGPRCVAAPVALQTPLVSLCVCPLSLVSVPPSPCTLGTGGIRGIAGAHLQRHHGQSTSKQSSSIMKCCCGSIFYICHFNFYDVNSRYLDFALPFFFFFF